MMVSMPYALMSHIVLLLSPHIVGYHYNTVEYIMLFYTALQWMMQNIHQSSYSHKTPHITPSRASYGVYIVRILERIDRVIKVRRCIM